MCPEFEERVQRMPWKYKFNHLQFFVVLVWFNVVINWFHELGHAVIGLLGRGVIDSIGIGAGTFWVDWATLPRGLFGLLMPFAGGLMSAVSCLIMIWASNYEPDVSVAFFIIGMSQLLYGTVEGLLFHTGLYEFIQPVGLAAMLLGAIYAIFTAKQMWNMEEVN